VQKYFSLYILSFGVLRVLAIVYLLGNITSSTELLTIFSRKITTVPLEVE